MHQVRTTEGNDLAREVNDSYRCPKDFLSFRLGGELRAQQGYFEFGPGTTCYGRSVKGHNLAQLGRPLSDTLGDVEFDGKRLVLPFDPNEVIDNLRLELYQNSRMGGYEHALKRLYYAIRPVTTRSVRKLVQKFRAANWSRRKFPQWPVDTTVESVCETLLMLSLKASGVDRVPFIWFWPEGAQGCVSITHDVEATAGRDFCGQMMDIDDSFGVKASFQVVPEGSYKVSPQFLQQLRERGFEVCVQDLNHDGRLFDRHEEFLRRAASINGYGREYGAKGFRSAVLYRKPEWYGELDFSYDMSFPNVAHLDPQRGGCCTVMPYFIGNLLEIPLTTIQDYTLLHVLGERSIELWEKQIETIFAKNGMATFIIHPDYMNERGTRSVYEALLGLLSDLRRRKVLWFALPRDIDRWWRARQKMTIEKTGSTWQIVGEDAGRATLAFARIVDGQLRYELAK